MPRPRVPARRHLAPGGLLAGLALTGTALSLGALQSHPADAAPRSVAHAAAQPSVLQAPAAHRASRGGARTALRPGHLPARYVTRVVPVGRPFSGTASWYGGSFQGRHTANGERFDTYELTAASRTLPFGTRLRVCRRHRCVVVRVNDRGPYVGSRVLDLSRAARDRLGHFGVARVTATPVATRRVPVHPTVLKRRAPVVPRPVSTIAPVPLAGVRPVSDGPQHVDGTLALGTLLAVGSGLAWLRRLRPSS